MTSYDSVKTGLGATIAAIGIGAACTAPASATTYTLEPWELGFDGLFGLIDLHITETELGGTMCPCTKIPYPSDLFHQQQGADAIAAADLQPGDTVMGFSGGANVISLYLHDHTPPPGTSFVLLGSPTASTTGFFPATGIDLGQGKVVSSDVTVPVNIVAREFEGWSDFPTNTQAPGYLLAVVNAAVGGIIPSGPTRHDYRDVRLDDPNNIVVTVGNLTHTLVPSKTLPINDWMRPLGLNELADRLDAKMRPLIDAAYDRPSTNASVAGNQAAERDNDPKPERQKREHQKASERRSIQAEKQADPRAEKERAEKSDKTEQ